MKKELQLNGNIITVEYQLTEHEKQVLNQVATTGYIEFRGDDQEDLETATDELCEAGFLENDDDAWHRTYVLTKLGELYAEKLKNNL